MFVSVRHLIDRARHPKRRADDLRALRERLAALPGPRSADPDLVSVACRLAELRTAMRDALTDVRSCSTCAKGHPEPFGHWDGGHCCGGATERVFSDDELAALKLSGTTAGRLVPPDAELAGCAFRGPTGCSLPIRDRPNLCVRFVCRELEAELAARGDLPRIRALQDELQRTFAHFAQQRASPLPPLPAEWRKFGPL